MNKPKMSIISAIGKNTRAIGKNNQLLWQLPEDLQRFKRLTTGHPIIMGLNTYRSIGRPLPDRTNIVLTRIEDNFLPPEGVIVAHTLDGALTEAEKHNQEEIFVIGGGQVYTMAITKADRLYLTLVNSDISGDTFFPDYSAFTKVISREDGKNNELSYQFVILEKE